MASFLRDCYNRFCGFGLGLNVGGLLWFSGARSWGFWAGSFRDFGLGFVGDLFLGCRGIRFLSLCCLKFALLMPVVGMCLMVLC